MNRSRHPGFPWLACLLVAAVSQPAGAWCDLVFKDVAGLADAVVLAEVRESPESEDGTRQLDVIEVFKGGGVNDTLPLAPGDLATDVKPGEQVLLALTRDNRLVQGNQGLGICSAVSVLPIRGGKLRARDRPDYDSGSRSMSLERLRRELSPASDESALAGTHASAR